MTNIASKIFYNTFWQIIFRAVEIVIGVVTLGLITRYLGQAQYGYYTTIMAWLQFFIILIDLGLYLTLLREISAKPVDQTAKIVNNIFTLRLFSSLVFLFLGIVIVQFLNYPAAIKTGVIALSFSYFFVSLVTVLTAIFQKQLVMPKIAAASLVNKVAFFIFVIYLISSGRDLQTILYAASLASFIYFLMTWIFTSKYLNLKLQFDWTYWKLVLIKTWPLAVTTALNLIYFKLDTLFLSWYQPAETVGLYGATYRVLEIATTFPHMFMGLVLPLLTAAWVSHDLARVKTIWQHSFDFFAFLTLPMIFGTLVLATPLMVLVAGPDFSLSGPILKILILATAAIFFGTLFTYMVLALDQQQKMIKYFAVAAVLSVIGYWWLIPLYSYWAAAWVTVIIETLIIIFAWLVVRRKFQHTPSLKTFGKLLAASFIMAVILYYLPDFQVLIKILVGLIVYLALVLMFKAYKLTDLKQLIFNSK